MSPAKNRGIQYLESLFYYGKSQLLQWRKIEYRITVVLYYSDHADSESENFKSRGRDLAELQKKKGFIIAGFKNKFQAAAGHTHA